MTDGSRILRTAGIPIVIAIVLLVALPKMCARAVVLSRARQQTAARTDGLHIESSRQPVSFPAGLDAERIRYLVEVDRHFSTPYAAHVSKTMPIVITPPDQKLIAALQRLGYLELGSDGSLTMTRDGMLHVDGLVEDASGWTFPLGSRQFGVVVSIAPENDTAQATIAWQWQGNAIGTQLIPTPKRHESNASFSNGNGRWALQQIDALDGDFE
jgi:hypothetical protein